jgi:hypothetical protein
MKRQWNAVKGLAAVGALCMASAWSVSATPVTYTFTATGPITGTLGGTPIGGTSQVLTFTFTSDTADVVSFTSPITGHENLVGTATITATDATTHAIIAQGTFLPADGMFVSIDNVNGGVGFGSAGALPGSGGFPGQPAYPLGLPISPANPAISYDLTSDITITGSNALSCLGFPGSCISPTALVTTGGDLILGVAGGQADVPKDSATFTAVLAAPVPEPATTGVLAMGLAGLLLARRRGRRA